MYSSTITFNIHEFEYVYSENKCFSSTSTIDYFTIYSIISTLECNHAYFHDYFNEYPVSNIKATFIIFSVAVSLTSVLTDYCYPLSRCYYYY